MRIPPPRKDRGIALVIVMMVILVLSILAGGFAYSMKVETKLARNTSWETDMEWLGRSGAELGKYALAMQLKAPAPDSMYSGLNQVWAGGPPNPTNEVLAAIQLKDHQLGPGKFTVSIIDMERKFSLSNITEQNPAILERALRMVGTDAADIPMIVDSYLDWVDNDPGHKTHLDGAENEFYLAMPSPYCAKNGPVDDIRELLLLRGMTVQIFWGTSRVGEVEKVPAKGGAPLRRPMSPYLQSLPQDQNLGVGLVDLFTPISSTPLGINVNTASSEALQLAGLDSGIAQAIISERNGPDGQPSTEDDTPFINVAEMLNNVPGFDSAMAQALGPRLTVQSQVFEITVDAEIGTYKRRFVSLVQRAPNNIATLSFSWK